MRGGLAAVERTNYTMQELLRWLCELQGIAVGQSEQVQFEFSRFPSGGLGLLVLIALVLMIVLVVFVYRRDGKNLLRWQRVVLGTLRALALLAAAALLLEPNLVAVKHETRPGHTILLLDSSQSMNQFDSFRRESVQAIGESWRSLGVVDPAAVTRFALAKALLAAGDGQLAKKLAAKNQAQFYGFAASIEPLPIVSVPAAQPMADGMQPPLPSIDIANLQAIGRTTNLGFALRAALDKSRNAEIAAVVLLTDGRRNQGPQGIEIARLLNQRKVPNTFVLGIGDPSETQLVGIGRFEAPEKVFQKDPFEMRGSVLAQGYDAMQVEVQLVRIDEKGVVTPIAKQVVVVGGEAAEAAVEFKDLTSAETGRFTYQMRVQPPSGEPPVAERHQRSQPVEVIGERTRVLLLSGGPSHEFQILRNLLIRDKTIDVSCWLQSADPKFPQDGDEGARIDALPEELKAFEPYDVAILIDPNPAKLTPSFCDALRKHVTENGCGLWWICGEKHALDALRPTAVTRPLAEILPIEGELSYAETVWSLGLSHVTDYPYSLTAEGEDGLVGKLTRIAESKEESRRLWSGLRFRVAFPIRQVKPAATVIAEDRLADSRLRPEGRGMPLIVTQIVGAGRVLYSGTDETYRWRSTYEDAYDRFWVKGIRYLFEGRLHVGNSRLRLSVSSEKIELGDAVTIAVEAKNELMQPLVEATFDVSYERDGQVAETLRLSAVAESPGNFQLQLRPGNIGSYRVRSQQRDGKPAEVPFQVVPAQIEREGPVDRAELSAIAAATGGRLFDSPQQLLAALDEIPSRMATDTYRTPHPVWDGFGTVAFMLTALALEWLLRKRFNLL